MRVASGAAVIVVATITAVAGTTAIVQAQGDRPEVVPRLDLAALEGAWFEVATTGSWALRRCETDTRHTLERRGARALRIISTCTARARVERRRGLIEAGRGGDGRLAIRYAPVLLSWAPGAWADFWVLALAEEEGWVLIGDRRRRSLAVFSRTIAPAESSLAQATAAARRLGYDVGRLRLVGHPAGPADLVVR